MLDWGSLHGVVVCGGCVLSCVGELCRGVNIVYGVCAGVVF